jgi:peptide deformylase
VDDVDLLTIVECGDPILRQQAEPLEPATVSSPEIQRLIRRMRVTMEAAPGVGIAAPQVGEAVQLAVLADGPERWSQLSETERAWRERTAVPFTVLVNPVLFPLADRGSVSFYEGCLSVPGLTGVVGRHRAVRVEALDEHGEPCVQVFSGWPARIVQHEIDHLQGILYLDRVATRSLATLSSYAEHWAGRRPAEAADALGFAVEPSG